MAGVGAPYWPWKAHRRGGRGGRRRGRGGAARGWHGEVGHHGEGCYGGVVGGTMGLQPIFGLLLYVKTGSRKENKRRRKERRKRKVRKRKEEKKEKNLNFFSNLKIFRKKNKR
jgi:hypothetical protein